jgi:hypothetical protein
VCSKCPQLRSQIWIRLIHISSLQNIYVSGSAVSYFPNFGTIAKLRLEVGIVDCFCTSDETLRAVGVVRFAAGEIDVSVLAGETKPTGQDKTPSA